ncbi:MAG: sterol desaturase family protein [Deltaproteobacteria bacterium]|nr:sterol desaturase family protein [Deltaproteobacteria bacterium]
MIAPLAFLAGALTWSASEYVIHRFVGHGRKRTRPRTIAAQLTPSGLAAAFNAEHLAHHADPSYFAPTSQKVAAAVVVTGTAAAVGSLLLGPRRGLSFAVGFGASYAAYEVLHRRVHTHPPRGRYGRWLRRHHLFHHHKTPRSNHGVTTPLWDRVFDTEVPVSERIRVPRRAAPPWMLDERGGLRPELAADYELVGAGDSPRVAV